MTVKRRRFIRVVSYLIAVSVVLATAGFFSQRAKAGYEETLGRVRMTNLTSLCEYSRDVSGGLRLIAVSTGESLADSMAYVRARVMGAVGCLNSFDSKNVENMSEFFVGTYSFAEKFTGSEEQRKAAVRLSDYAQQIYYHLNDVSSAVMNGAYSLTEYGSAYRKNELPYFEEHLDFENGNEKEIFGLIKPTAADTGDFSLLSGKGRISEDEARAKASGAVELNSALWRKNEKNADGIEIYLLTHGDTEVDISVAGGILCRLVNPLPCAAAVYSQTEAQEKARNFLKRQGYPDMVLMSGEQSEFAARFSFAPEVNGILLLTASVEIDVCLASGEITFFDGAQYIKNYSPEINADMGSPDLGRLLPDNLVLNKTLPCIADIGGRERLCYLAVCSFEGDEVWVCFDGSSLEVLKTEIR